MNRREKFRMIVQFQGQPNPHTYQTKNADRAVRLTRSAFAAGAFFASVVRVRDDQVIYDGPLGIEPAAA